MVTKTYPARVNPAFPAKKAAPVYPWFNMKSFTGRAVFLPCTRRDSGLASCAQWYFRKKT
jgi:hypothetical protein